MGGAFDSLFHDLKGYIVAYGVAVPLKTMDVETPGEFDGLSIAINPLHHPESRSYYLAHAFGSIVQWSTDFKAAEKVFKELRAATRSRQQQPDRFEEALKAYCRFEQTSSEHAVWMFEQIGCRRAIRPYTVFFRADLAAMTIFHRTGHSPRWPQFYAQWKRRAKSGDVWVKPFTPKPFSRFQPVRIEQQAVWQQRD